MPNPKGHIPNLKHYQSTWKHGKTKTIRVPIALADQVLAYARQLDEAAVATQFSAQSPVTTDSISEAVKLLNEALTFRANAGGKIKAQIKLGLNHLKQVNKFEST